MYFSTANFQPLKKNFDNEKFDGEKTAFRRRKLGLAVGILAGENFIFRRRILAMEN